MALLYLPRKTRIAKAARGWPSSPYKQPQVKAALRNGLIKPADVFFAYSQGNGKVDIKNNRPSSFSASNVVATNPRGQHLSFSGTAGQGLVFDIPSFTASGHIHIAAYIKTTSTSTLSFLDLGSSTSQRYTPYINAGSVLSYDGAANIYENISGDTAINDGDWHVVLITITPGSGGTTQRLYVDGTYYSNILSPTAGTHTINRVTLANNYARSFQNAIEISDCVAWQTDNFLGVKEITAVTNNFYATFFEPANQSPFLIGTSAAGTAYTLTADAGSYTYTGTAATLKVGRKLAAASGTYTYTGSAATLKAGYSVSADSGTYTYTGTAATLKSGRVLTAGAGSYAYTGSDATLTYTPTAASLTAEAGSYTYTGQDVTFKRGLVLSAGGGTYSYTGQDATLTYTPVGAFTLTADSGTYTYTGQDAGSSRTYVVPATGGTYTYTGSAAGLGVGYKLAFDAGVYTYTGTAATFDRTYVLAAGVGTYTYTGQDVSFDYSGVQIWTEVSDTSTTWTPISDASSTWTEI